MNRFVELDLARNMSCFFSTILYYEKQTDGSSYQETSDGVLITFLGHLKFGGLRFENLDLELRIKNQKCSNATSNRQHNVVAELSGNYKEEALGMKLGIYEITPDSKIQLEIGENSKTDSKGSFSGLVNVLGFKKAVKVDISHEGLEFQAEGKIYGMFDVSAIFKSGVVPWKDQRYIATGNFERNVVVKNLYRVLEIEMRTYINEIHSKIQKRLQLSTQAEERAKSRLKEVQVLRDKWLRKLREITREYNQVDYGFILAEKKFEKLSDLVEEYSDEIRLLFEELNELCQVKVCHKMCQKGRSCYTCWKDITAKKMGQCPATCHQTKQTRLLPFEVDAICKNEYCKRIHAVHSPFGDLLGLVIGIGGMALGLPPRVSFGIGSSVSKFVRSVKKGDPDFGELLSGAKTLASGLGASKAVVGGLKAAKSIVKGNINPLSIAEGVTDLGFPLSENIPDEFKSVFRDVKMIRDKLIEFSGKDIIPNFNTKISLLFNQDVLTPIKGKIKTMIKQDILLPTIQGEPLPFKENILSSFENELESTLSSAKNQLKNAILNVEQNTLLAATERIPKDDIFSSFQNKILSLFTEKLNTMVSFANDKVDKALSTIKEQTLEEVRKLINEELSSARDKINKGFSSVESKIGKTLSSTEMEMKLSAIADRIDRKLSKHSNSGGKILNSLLSGVKDKINSAINKGLISNINQQIIPRIKDKISSSSVIRGAKAALNNAAPVVGKIADAVNTVAPIVSGVSSLIDRSQGHWECEDKEDKCKKENFNYHYEDIPYTCQRPCEKRYVKETIQQQCCSNVDCARVVANISCMTENKLCKKARKYALEKILKFKASAAEILVRLDSAEQNVSLWRMKKERLSVRVRSVSKSLKVYQESVQSLEKAYNVTVENRKRTLKILAKPLMLSNLVNEFGESFVMIENITFKVKVSAHHDTKLLPINVILMMNGTKQEVSTVLDFTNLKISLRSISKDILFAYVGDISRVSRKKRSTQNTYNSTDDLKFYTLQTFHRLCSEFNIHRQTLYDVAMSIYNLSSHIQQIVSDETQRENLFVNNSAIFEQIHINKTKAMEFGIDVNYDSFSNVIENDPELLEANKFQNEVLNNELEAVESSSKLFYKNWLATMESIFETISDECSGFEDCLGYTIDSLSQIIFDLDQPSSKTLREQIEQVERKFINLTRESDMSTNDAVHISLDILQILENMTGAEDVCAQAPNITENPSPFTEIAVNETLVLRCNATGDSLVYQWRFNGEILKNQSTNILRINKTIETHSGNYTCDVSNHVARVTSILATVVVGTRPLIVRHPPCRHNVVLSDYDSIRCQVKKDTRNITYQWWFKSFRSNSFNALPNETFSYLSFVPVKANHEGWYYCNISNQFGHTISNKSFVKVLKYSLPVLVAKLSLTVVSKSRDSNTSLYYQDALAKVLTSRFPETNGDTQLSGERIKVLHRTSCKMFKPNDDRFDRTDICDWTFSAIGENITSSKTLNMTTSQQIKTMITKSFTLKRLIGQFANKIDEDGIIFSFGKTKHSVQKNSLSIIAMKMLCPKRQFLEQNIYKCGKLRLPSLI